MPQKRHPPQIFLSRNYFIFELFLLGDGEKKIEEKVFSVAHPNVPEMFIRVQTDGSITAKEALVQVIKKLMQDLSHLSREFTREFELRRMVEAGRSNQQGQ
ncbi:DNA-directed RNA polymerase ii subunit rpb11 [Colletotrichum higginsianum IMI 349063]|uniref:DNA-directed RNA polymerase ii subunit rpb11 n=1 Tax=Colletotrichum higginsianum (strain IMI 349063) TaxID=759273 RepID=A0A1B7YIY6_COLHI|nr:DNA-directed RNA polymerase ii subunit rpb11 [Colletotrichum higginsianum IMI 349063]OBR11922.1 DNA-directed RNA polymerase ii subunit rpb11 [Colletotrichum higginsianum IMI 349063]GJC93598.1 DNA-directed RNA polymerase ii subunit rpb11 [Colletotrichum higginsianum]